MNLRYLDGAVQDIMQAQHRLEGEHPGYGVDFGELVDRAIISVRADPRFYPRTEDGPRNPENREYYIKRFEYRLIYAVTDSELVILALVHARNRPRGWVRRMRDLK